jgi:FkbM family methyltransferase
MVLDFSDNASFKYASDREHYEEVESAVMASAIKANPGSIVLDVGANYGAYTLPAAQFALRGAVSHVIALEPDRRPFRALSKSVRINNLSRVCDVYQMIASDRDGPETLWVNARSSADNRTHSVLSSKIRVRESYTVSATTIDTLFRRRGLPTDTRLIIKMDIQGNEPRALYGMKRLLDEVPGWLVLFEYGPYLVESAGLDPGDFLNWLELLDSDGFGVFSVAPTRGLATCDRSGFLSAMRHLQPDPSFHGEAPVRDFMISRGMNLSGVGAGRGES